MRGRGILGPWEKSRKLTLGALAVVAVFLVVVISLPIGIAVLGLALGAAMTWKAPGVLTDRTLGTYTPTTIPHKIAAFFATMNMNKAKIFTPNMVLSFGPPAADMDHNLPSQAWAPFSRLAAWWSLVFGLIAGLVEFALHIAHHPFWGSAPPSFVLYPLSVLGFFVLGQAAAATRRFQGDANETYTIEPKPATMFTRVTTDIPLKALLSKSAIIGAVPAGLALLLWPTVNLPWWIVAIAVPSLLLITAAVGASRIASQSYLAGWENRNAQRQRWTEVFGFMRDVPIYVGQQQLPDFDTWNKANGHDPEKMYVPEVEVATFLYPPNGVFRDFVGQEDRIKGAITDSQGNQGATQCAIVPMGALDGENQEIIGTVGSQGFRVWYTAQQTTSLLTPGMSEWMLELMCRSTVVSALARIKGIGHATMNWCGYFTKPDSEATIIEIRVTPDSGVNLESFLDRLEDIQANLGVPWVRAGRPESNSQQNVISLLFGDVPTKSTRFVNPTARARRRLDGLEWAYIWNALRLRGRTGGPTFDSRIPATPVVDKLVFNLPDGLPFDAVAGRLSTIKTTALYEFMEIEQGADADPRKSLKQKIIDEEAQASKFTIVASRKDPLKRPFKFIQYGDRILTGREPGVAKMDWSPGVHADDSLASHDFAGGGEEPHLLIAGASGSGKSVVMNSLILQLAYNNGPSELRFWAAEPKNELQSFEDVDLMDYFVDSWTPGESFISNVADQAQACVKEMQERNEKMRNHPKKPKNLAKAREIAINESERNGTPVEDHPLYIPYLLYFIEECATLFAEVANKEEKEHQARLVTAVAELARKSRSSGIFLVCATQYPTNASIPSVVRQQMSRIGMKCQNSMASRVVIEEDGLESIRTKGVGMSKRNGRYRQFRGFWVQDGDVDKIDPDTNKPYENDIHTVLGKIPQRTSAGQIIIPGGKTERLIVPDFSDHVFRQWDSSATARKVADHVNSSIPTKDTIKIKPDPLDIPGQRSAVDDLADA